MGITRVREGTVEGIDGATDTKKIFVDRESQREFFNEKLTRISEESGSANSIYYAGSGGIGKTALLREIFEKRTDLKKIAYDFTSGTDMFMVLNALRGILIRDHQVEFPLYEKACVYHYQKTGDIANSSVKIQDVLRESSIIKLAAQRLERITWEVGDAHIVGRAAATVGSRLVSIFSSEDFQDILRELGDTSTFLRASKIVLDRVIKYNADKDAKENPDHTYRKLVEELERRNSVQQIDAVKEFMPKLFAQDLSTWLSQNDTNLVILFDTYEKLTGIESGVPRHEKLIYENVDVPADWWVEELINHTKRVLWVIAGRGEVKKIGDKLPTNICYLKELDYESAEKFLSEAGIDDSRLRQDIFKLTGGYPIYLNLCVDSYKERLGDSTTTKISIADVSEDRTREKVVERLLKYMDYDAQHLAYCLCILGTWTEDFVSSILFSGKIINPLHYDHLKNLSFISAQAHDFEGKSVFIFDRTIQEILLAHVKKTDLLRPLLKEMRDAVNKFFGDEENLKNFSDFQFTIWYEVILRTTDDANDLMKQFKEKLLPMQNRVSKSTMKTAVAEFKAKVEKILKSTWNFPHSYFEQLLVQINFSEGNKEYATDFAKSVYEKILIDPEVTSLKNFLTAEHYAMALFHAMGTAKGNDDCNTFKEKFKIAVKDMSHDQRKGVCESYGEILKCLLEVYRSNNEVIDLIEETMKFVDGDKDFFGECLNEFVADLWLYKLAALSHLGKIEQYREEIPKCVSAIRAAGNSEKCVMFINRKVVQLQDVFNYAESLKLGDEVLKSLHGTFKTYEDQYLRLCGSLATTCYLTLNKSHSNLTLARKYSDIAIKGFKFIPDKMRSYQVRAQIEAEAGNFNEACGMLDKALNITIENPQAEPFKNFDEWQWYHFAKFCERLLSSSDGKYFDIAKRALEIAREEFLTYRNGITVPEHPDYITFSKMATCFDILKDFSLSIDLHEEALRGVNAEVNDNISDNANGAALRLVMMANELRTLEKNEKATEAEELKQKIKSTLDEYLGEVGIDSMKVPFAEWFKTINDAEQMSRAILL